MATVSPIDIGCLPFARPVTSTVKVPKVPSWLPAVIDIPVVSAPTIALPCANASQLAELVPTFKVVYGFSFFVVM